MPYYDIPVTPAAKPLWNRFMQENAALSSGNVSGRRRPMPPRSLQLQAASQGVLVTWQSPQNANGILGYKVYQDNDLTAALTINDPSTRQALMKVAADSNHAFYVSSFNAAKESVKVIAKGASSTEQYVVAGTSGGTGGTYPGLPPGFSFPPGYPYPF